MQSFKEYKGSLHLPLITLAVDTLNDNSQYHVTRLQVMCGLYLIIGLSLKALSLYIYILSLK